MSGRGRAWLVSPSKQTLVVEDRMILGLVADENTATVALEAGLNLLVVKTVNTFAADAVAIDGKRSLMFGMEARDVPNGMGVLEGENEWSVAASVVYE